MTAVVTRFLLLIWLLLPFSVFGQEVEIRACQNFGCKRQKTVKLNRKEVARLHALFRPRAQTPAKERVRIGQAIALMERIIGPKVGTHRDQAFNHGAGEPGQLDCIAESRNSRRYLRFFQKQGWLAWHQVGKRIKRHPWIFDIHWSATIKDRNSGRVYAVDSWFAPNGKVPQIIGVETWLRGEGPD